jgi:hypothetical protein
MRRYGLGTDAAPAAGAVLREVQLPQPTPEQIAGREANREARAEASAARQQEAVRIHALRRTGMYVATGVVAGLLVSLLSKNVAATQGAMYGAAAAAVAGNVSDRAGRILATPWVLVALSSGGFQY